MSNPSRKRLATWSSISARNVAWQLPDAVELEASQGVDLVRTRVFFEEATMVAIHRARTPLYLVLTGLYALFFLIVAGATLAGGGESLLALILAAIALPGLIAFLIRLFLGVDVITVVGPRSRVTVRYAVRKRRARETYGALCAAVRDAHRKLEREYAEDAAPATEVTDAPLPPEISSATEASE